ncbi:Co2+/Mg2+ efflux protein ApaG [Burkholderiaceae bacterium DAT-1]|nr:Co2+/Mg2+ efflux protein ApaG [Burkholderiaceae bacterium DAT-1]
MAESTKYEMSVSVTTHYLAEQSDTEAQRFVFAYQIKIRNTGTVAGQLLSRHWVIRDGESQVQEVRGMGVVGEQPNIQPGEEFEYVSGAALTSQVGTMEGSYQFIAADGVEFQVMIDPFVLSVPRVLH